MDRAIKRPYTQINDDKKHYHYHDHDHTYSAGFEKNIKRFKRHHDHTYSKCCDHRTRISGNRRYRKPRSNEYRSAKIRDDGKWSKNQRLYNLASVAEISNEHFITSHGLFEHSSVKQRSPGYASAEHRSTGYSLTDHRTTEHVSVDIQSSVYPRTTDCNSTKFPSQDDIAKCLLMKVYRVIEPRLQKLLLCIFKDKQDHETLELYAKRHGMESKWQKHFSDEQIKSILQNSDFDGFDSTLIFRCIEVLRDFNPTLIINENVKLRINDTMKKLKITRNLLCHNRKILTDIQCHDIANSLKNPLENLKVIIHILDRDMDINIKKTKISEEVIKIMNGGLNEEEFRYMCLLKVISCNTESVLNNVTQLLCYDKQERENHREYFKRKGMNTRTYKDTFFKDEQDILEGNSDEVKPDLTLYCKIIEACIKWHPSLKDDENGKKELIKILKQIRSIRNHVTHRMLSMSSSKCKTKAQELGNYLEDLINFIQNIKSDMALDAAKININQIKTDINSIMSVPYTFL